MKEIERFMRYVHEWRVRVFGKRPVQGDILKLREEVEELMHAVMTDPYRTNDKEFHSELADCFILILGIASARNLTFEQLLGHARDKMLINESRNWNFKGDRTAQHTEEEVKELPFKD